MHQIPHTHRYQFPKSRSVNYSLRKLWKRWKNALIVKESEKTTTPDPSTKFHGNLFICFHVILLTNQPTNRHGVKTHLQMIHLKFSTSQTNQKYCAARPMLHLSIIVLLLETTQSFLPDAANPHWIMWHAKVAGTAIIINLVVNLFECSVLYVT